MRRAVLFDLDGTLTDPGQGITNSILYALGKMGIPAPPRRELYAFIGPPLLESFASVFHLTRAEAQHALEVYREYFSMRGLYENEVYPGIPETLAALREAGLRLCLATSKPEPFARRILAHFALDGYFDLICGSGLDGSLPAKKDVIAHALALGSISPDDAVMVGDRRHDAEGAAACALPAVGVLWGYGSEDELKTAGAAALVRTPDELKEILLHGNI